MRLPIKPLPFKPPRLKGLPRALMDEQYEKHYGQALQRFNVLADSAESDRQTNATAISRLRVDLSMHELAFASLTDEPAPASPALSDQIQRDLGSATALRDGIAAAAGRRQDGWLTLCATPSETFELAWCPTGTGLPADLTARLAFDLSPHIWESYFPDNPATYAEHLIANINWSAADKPTEEPDEASPAHVENIAQKPPVCTPEELANALDSGKSVQVFDVRQADDLQPEDIQVAGSAWQNPNQIKELAASLSADHEVVVYCVYGGWVSEGAASALRSHGINARLLAGGISSWSALDLPKQQLDAAATEAIG